MGLSLVVCNITHADAPRRALVVPVQLSGYVPDRDVWQPAFDERLVKSLLKGGYETAKPTRKEWSACTDDLCFSELAAKYHSDLVMGGEVRASQAAGAPSYHIVVWLLDSSRSALRKKVEKDCPACTETDASEALSHLALQILTSPPAPSETPSTEPSPAPSLLPIESPQPTSQPATSSGSRTAMRATGITLLVIGVGGFVGGGVETARAQSVDVTHERRTVDGQALFYTIGAVGVVGGAVLTALGWWPQQHGVTIVPHASSSTAGVNLVGKF